MINLILTALLQLSNADSADREFLKQQCLKDLNRYKNKAAVCLCYDSNLAKRMSENLMAILVKEKRGESVEKEMDTVEGASVIFTFEESILLKCVKNPNYDVGPEER